MPSYFLQNMRGIFLWFFLLLVGCSHTLTPLTIEQSKQAAQAPTSDLTGYILFGIASDAFIEDINILGVPPLRYSPKSNAVQSQFVLAQVPIGLYAFSSVKTGLGLIKAQGDHAWSFKIESNKINYVGHLELLSIYKWCHCYRLHLANKSSFAVEYVQDSHAELLAKAELVYKGPGSDYFIEFAMKNYQAKKEGMQ